LYTLLTKKEYYYILPWKYDSPKLLPTDNRTKKNYMRLHEDTLPFLQELTVNNNRPWFDPMRWADEIKWLRSI